MACTWGLEACRVGGSDRVGELVRRPVGDPVRMRAVEVGLQQGGGAGLHDAVGEELHRPGGQPARGGGADPVAVGGELAELVLPDGRLGPEREVGAEPQRVGGRGGQPGVHLVRVDPGVLDPGDPGGGEQRRYTGQGGDLRGRARCGEQVQDRPDGPPLAQGAQRRPVGAADDLPRGRLGGAGVDAGPAQRLAVDPHGVVVHRAQYHRPAGDDPVQPAGVEPPAGGQRGVERVTGHPLRIGVLSCPSGDRGQDLVHAAGLPHRGPAQAEPAQQRVRVPVAERGQQSAPGQVGHLGPRAAAVQRVLAQREHPPAGHGQRRGGGRARHARADRAAGEQLVCLHQRLLNLN
jgi:hypothetical protein